MKSILFVTAALLIPATTHADETLKVRTSLHYVKAEAYSVGDMDGHAMLIGYATGIASFTDGSVGTTTLTTYGDYIKGSGAIPLLNSSITTSDGSTVWFKASGETVNKGARSEYQGPIVVISGTGKFAGAKGEGTFSGARLQPFSSGAELYSDIVINLKTGDQAEAARAMLMKAVAAIKADRDVALTAFQKGEGGFRDGDLYPFCSRATDGKALSGPVAVLADNDTRTLKDTNGKLFGKEQFEVALKNPEGSINEVSEYMFPLPGTKEPAVPKKAYVTHVADLICGVGYYK
jgi:hypothetical protein